MKTELFQSFPVSSLFNDLRTQWDSFQRIVVKADPGAGKSTILPLFILEEKLVRGKIIMLEPRRMAARTLARYMSSLMSWKCGDTIGYKVRGDVCCSPEAKIQIVTEGVFVRMIQDDPFLEGVSLVIMDEFHERNIFTDLSFAFLNDVQSNLNPDLKLIIMTATPEVKVLERVLPDFLYLESEGRMFPVSIQSDGRALETRVRASRIRSVLDEVLRISEGNILIFLPGEREILDLMEDVRTHPLVSDTQVIPLYGRLSPQEQDRALNPPDERIIVAATSIAETSLTIPGISCVIDTGLERKPQFDPNAGLSRLVTKTISRASARQRAGRAGRVREGLCIRLWDQNDESLMDDFPEPEILNADLSSLALEILVWGAHDPGDLVWVDLPPAAHYHQARSLLYLLIIIDSEGRLQPEGKSLAGAGVHPRLAHMLDKGRKEGREQTACALAALLSEGDWLPFQKGSDIRLRLEILKEGKEKNNKRVIQILRTWESLLVRCKIQRTLVEPGDSAALLCHSYPDRIARIRGERIYQMSGGGNCRLRAEDPVQTQEFLIAPLVGGSGDIPSCFLTSPLEKELLWREFSPLMEEEAATLWDEKKCRVSKKVTVKLGNLPLREDTGTIDAGDPQLAMQLAFLFRKRGLEMLPWSQEDKSFLDRIQFARCLKKNNLNWPDTGEESLLSTLDRWFLPLLIKGKLEGRLKDGLASLLGWEERQFLDRQVPERLIVPSGSRIRIDYSTAGTAAVDVRLQEIFGLTETPLLAGEVPILFRLLNPAQRPIQLTRDLKSFWENTYQEVRKELRGRYPKHYWPEDPSVAEPTRRVRR
ncbi:ATP-dependent helicase HrpB [Oceanispirochaeta sp.]|jgi:ATP-dependent helicase HrpB|uniref:ATP-dependent helicase HrpB n=1 Tax=Oceanispirochaeta sp. TaxID=2035350 RepID=UPI00263290B8|nr:ATP-dependent helicase HrpB [Oceanispirochaeta sp.]MDA3956006.1 ATP-dependent helicase HrpB [Oceanispirochaeta sp.]